MAPVQKSIPNKAETTTPPAYMVTEILVSTYATMEKMDNTHLDLASKRFSKNSGIVNTPLRA